MKANAWSVGMIPHLIGCYKCDKDTDDGYILDPKGCVVLWCYNQTGCEVLLNFKVFHFCEEHGIRLLANLHVRDVHISSKLISS